MKLNPPGPDTSDRLHVSRASVRRAIRQLLVLAALVGTAATLTSCGSTPTASTTTVAAGQLDNGVCCVAATSGAEVVNGFSTAHNGWDIAFLSWFTPHDYIASEMADLAQTRARSQTVKELAASISDAQGPRYLEMTGMAAAWGEPKPSTDPSATAAHNHGAPGTSTSGDPKVLVPLKGAAFDRKFLLMMIAHHQAGQETEEATVKNGSNPQAKKLAAELETSQKVEITRMRQMLKRL